MGVDIEWQSEQYELNYPRLREEFQGRIDALEAEAERWKADYMRATELVAKMHAAAVGEVRGPAVGVVEDVAQVREDVRALAIGVRVSRSRINDWLSDEESDTEDLEEFVLPQICDDLASLLRVHGAKYLDGEK